MKTQTLWAIAITFWAALATASIIDTEVTKENAARIIQLEEDVRWLQRTVKVLNERSGTKFGDPRADEDLKLIIKMRRHLEACCGVMK